MYEMFEMPTIRTPRIRTLSLQPRPRSPYQFVAMMEAIAPFDGIEWWKKDQKGNLVSQIQVGNAIAKHEAFNIFPKSERILQFRTYVTMNPPTLGFAYINDDRILAITPVGKLISQGVLLQTLFFRQLLKWQYPSCWHGGSGGKGSAHFPLRNEWSIHPFLSALAICDEIDYMTKDEVAIFLLTTTKDDERYEVAEEIREFRQQNSLLNSRERRENIYNKCIEKLREAYQPEINALRYKIRQRENNTPEEMLEVKRRNMYDYADTIMRYFRFTELFRKTDRIRRLVIDPFFKWKAEMILEEKSFLKINKDIDNKEKYYAWFGDPKVPKFPWESEDGLLEEVLQNVDHSISIMSSIVNLNV